jgi:hypothetical protein
MADGTTTFLSHADMVNFVRDMDPVIYVLCRSEVGPAEYEMLTRLASRFDE